MTSLNSKSTKLTQKDLRRFMSEQKKKHQSERVDSPIAKYRSDGQITCAVCNIVIKNEKLWKVHVNGILHRDNLVQVKQNGVLPTSQSALIPNVATKRTLPNDSLPVPSKKIKGILKNAPKPEVPNGFFESPNAVKVENEQKNPLLELQSNSNESDEGGKSGEDEKMDEDELAKNNDIPKGFFDDPVLDAKARHVEYKDPIQEEWERFQKEIKEEHTVSDQIIEVNHEEAIAERQIDEIDEQLRNWSRVLDLEVKKEKVQAETLKVAEEMEQGASSDEQEDFDEFLDWRAKGSFR